MKNLLAAIASAGLVPAWEWLKKRRAQSAQEQSADKLSQAKQAAAQQSVPEAAPRKLPVNGFAPGEPIPKQATPRGDYVTAPDPKAPAYDGGRLENFWAGNIPLSEL